MFIFIPSFKFKNRKDAIRTRNRARQIIAEGKDPLSYLIRLMDRLAGHKYPYKNDKRG